MTEMETYRPTAPAVRETAPAALVAWADAASAAHRLAAPLVATDFVPVHFRPKNGTDEALNTARAAATAAILYGSEAGLSPMQSLQSIYVIGGKPALYARAMLAITLGAGHEVWTEETTDKCAVVCGRRRGSEHVERIVVTIEQARAAGWTSNKKYTSEPATMLLARAQSQACRRVAPDALLGLAYSAEELEDSEPEPTTTVQRSTTRRAQRAKAEPVVVPEPDLDPPTEPVVYEASGMDEFTPAGYEPITGPQMKKLHALLNEKGYGDRDAGLAYLSSVVGRGVDTSKSLSKDEARRVIDALENPEPPIEEPEIPWNGGQS